MSAQQRWYATGKRKTAVARVYLTPGDGKIFIRKWRIVAKGSQTSVSVFDKQTQQVVEEPIVYAEKLAEGEYGVPTTARYGKKPFRYTPVEEYFGRETSRMILQQPFDVTKTNAQFDVYANVAGGGLSGQAGAIRHAISKALIAYERANLGTTAVPVQIEGEEGEVSTSSPIRRALKRAGFITRDARIKERKKYGRPAARKRFQYSKR